MKSISLYVDNGSWLCKVHPFTKLAYIATAISVPLLVGKLSFFAIFIALSLAVLASGRLLKRVVPLIAFSFTIGPLHFYREGLLYALHIGCNVLNMLLSFAILVLSAKPSELVEELEKRGFSRRMGYIITSVFQIVPQMTGTMNTITDAQRSRGLETEGSLLTRAKAFLPLISPVVMSSLINTRERAVALEVRGFAAKQKKTYLADRTPHRGDTPITVVLLAMIAAALLWRIVQCL